jgi:hypothetical protein
MPAPDALKLEEKSFDELTILRQALLDALRAHNSKIRSGT